MVNSAKGKIKKFLTQIIMRYECLPFKPFNKLIGKILNSTFGAKNRNENMVFGIGLSRTGTLSLDAALNELGIRSKHFIFFPISTKIPYLYLFLNKSYGATDISISANYKKIDKMYPNSKFILTIRNLDSWLDSYKRFFLKRKYKNWLDQIHLKIYHSTKWDDNKFKIGYYEHLKDVKKYFKSRPNDLLILDIVGGEGYEKLCPFLSKEILDKPFPHENKSAPH